MRWLTIYLRDRKLDAAVQFEIYDQMLESVYMLENGRWNHKRSPKKPIYLVVVGAERTFIFIIMLTSACTGGGCNKFDKSPHASCIFTIKILIVKV